MDYEQNFRKVDPDWYLENVFVQAGNDMAILSTQVLMDFYQALGEEEGYFDSAQFEENMSTHYGRMIHEDDRTIMFASPEDAAEYLGWDLTIKS